VTRSIAIVLKGYPRLSETFIAQELRGLQTRGLAFTIHSLRRPTDSAIHPLHREIAAPLHYLPEYLHEEPRRVARAWRALRRSPRYGAARRIWLEDLAREPSRNRIRRFGQALVLAHELPAGTCHLHAHFLHTPASVARYASLLTGLPWSCSAHAKDIWTTSDWEKREKLASLAWLVACTRAGAAHLAGLAAEPAKVELLYHGLDPARFPAPPAARPARDGRDAERPVVILSVGRLVEKKGYADLLAALARLPSNLHWRLVHIGGGPLGAALVRQAEASGLARRIEWLGPQPQERVIAEYRCADLFALACKTAADGDRDGIPNVLLEAQGQALACLSTFAGAVPELIENEVSGILVEEGDVPALDEALARLISTPDLRARLGRAGAERQRKAFDFTAGLDRLAVKLGLAPTADDRDLCALRSMRR
jgi:glycosyltransferase involved in cell wall biosynthesis